MTPSGGAGTSVTIGLVTALPIESAAMRLLIDNDVAYTAPGDRGGYRLGTVPSTSVEHPHQVALTVLPLDGTRNAADRVHPSSVEIGPQNRHRISNIHC